MARPLSDARQDAYSYGAMKQSAPAGKPRPAYVVIGTSTGGGAALTQVFKDLPEDFPAAILIVIHVGEGQSKDWLIDRLRNSGRLPVKGAEHGETILPGNAYVAPAGTHLIVRDGRFELGSGPREQYARPAIDVLFRTAAADSGPPAVGVILTGMLRDGTLGLRAVRDAGGITIVQDPDEAEAGDMPRNAMKDLEVDYCLDLAEIGPALDLLVRRAGSNKRSVLETGLATSVRLMKTRVRLLGKLHEQSRRNPRTQRFLTAEIIALEEDIGRIRGLIPAALVPAPRRARPGASPSRAGAARRARRPS